MSYDWQVKGKALVEQLLDISGEVWEHVKLA